LALVGGLQIADAQEKYYWNGNQKIALTPNQSSVIVYLTTPQKAEAVFDMSNRDLRTLRDQERPAQQHWIADLQSARFDSPELAMRSLVTDPAQVTGASFGLRINGGMPVWLTRDILLEPNESYNANVVASILARYGSPEIRKTKSGLWYLSLSESEQVIPLSNELYESGMFLYAHPDFMVHTTPASTYPPPTDTCESTDAFFQYQYYLHSPYDTTYAIEYPYVSLKTDIDIDAPEAWCITKGDASIKIAIIDEGVQYHEDMLDSFGVSRILPGYTTGDTMGTGAPELIDDAHGQGVAGIIAASHDNEGVAGIAPYASILPIHVFTDGTSPLSHFAKAIDWAWKNDADIINNSWGMDTCGVNIFPALEVVINNARTLGRS
ncbi:MAG: S8 family serine peptidase, partial [Bacteroidota bacterium]